METMPTAAELIEAAIHTLRTELLPALHGREAFQARVVANVLEIARRELRDGPSADAAERARVAVLVAGLDAPAQAGSDPAATVPTAAHESPRAPTDPAELPALRRALCEAVRDGRADATTPGLLDHLWADVLARVAIEQPTYPSFVRETRTERAPERH